MIINKKHLVLIYLLLFSIKAFPQLEGNNLYSIRLGLNWDCGRLNFSNNVLLGLGGSYDGAGVGDGLYSTCISDRSGNLLFFYSYLSFYDRNFHYMPHHCFFDTSYGHKTNVINPFIVPDPSNSTKYYVFISRYLKLNSDSVPSTKLYSAVVDMSKNSGLGDVIVFNTIENNSIGITALKADNKKDYWIITFRDKDLLAYKLSGTGVSNTPVVSNNVLHDGILSASDLRVKSSLQGNMIAVSMVADNTDNIGKLLLLKFNNKTGKADSSVIINPYKNNNIPVNPAVEFSPDGNKIYVLGRYDNFGIWFLAQYDISIFNKYLITNSNKIIGSGSGNFSQLRYELFLGPDGYIYVTDRSSMILDCIKSPNLGGLDCKYEYNPLKPPLIAFSPITRSFITRRPYIWRFHFDNSCTGIPVHFNLDISKTATKYFWNFGDTASGKNNFSNAPEPEHIYSNPGCYFIRLVTLENGVFDTSGNKICIQNPPLNNLPKDTVICNSDSVILNAGNPGCSYLWKNDSTSQTIKLFKNETVWVKITKNTCSITDTINVRFNPFKKGLNLGNDTSICQGDSLKLSSSYPEYSNIWSTGEKTASVYIKKAGLYSLHVSSDKCQISDSIYLDLNPFSTVYLGSDKDICGIKPVELNAGSNFKNYYWNTGETNQKIIVINSGKYFVEVTDHNGCRGKDSINIKFHSLPVFDLGKDTSICPKENNVIDIRAVDFYSYYWQPNGETGRSIKIFVPGTYSLTACDSFNCCATDSIRIHDCCEYGIYVPDAFSPNNDGINDIFEIITSNEILRFNISIFNRWGEKIFSTTGINKGWDGTYKGIQCETGVYYYHLYIENTNNKTTYLSGNVGLLR